jgi:hypothetical protein
MNFLLTVLGQHLWAAVVKNWFSTVVGVVGAVALGWGPISTQFLVGHDWNTVNWQQLGAAVGVLAWGAFSKIALNWKSLLGDLTASAPRAEPVKKT